MRKTILSVLLAGSLAAGGAVAVTSTMSAGAATASNTAPKAKPANQAKHPHLRRAIRRAIVRISAKTIGIEPADLVKELRAGKSIAEVANAHHVAPQKVIDALVKAGTARIEKAVTNGHLTRARANKLEARLPALATKVVNHHRAH